MKLKFASFCSSRDSFQMVFVSPMSWTKFDFWESDATCSLVTQPLLLPLEQQCYAMLLSGGSDNITCGDLLLIQQ